MINNKSYSAFLAMLVTIIALTGCKKTTGDYVNYQNQFQQFDGNALEYLQSQSSGYDSVLKAINRFPDIKEALATQEITLFMPVNASFASAFKYLNQKRASATPARGAISIENADETGLHDMLCKYVLVGRRDNGAYVSSADGAIFPAFSTNYPMHIKYSVRSASGFQNGGAAVLSYSDTKRSIFTQDWVVTNTDIVNIQTKNAVINVLSNSHNFGFDEFTSTLDK